MKVKTSYILIAIIVLGFFLRFYKLSTNFLFSIDQSEDLYRLQEIADIVKSGKFTNLPIKGEAGTDNSGMGVPIGTYSVYTGVFYFYFLLPIAVAVSFSPFGLTVFFALLNIGSIPLVYFAGKELFNKKTGLIAAYLYAVSYWVNAFARTIWTPSPEPVFVLISLCLMLLVKKGKIILWPLLLFSISALSQIHDSGYYYSGYFLLLIFCLKLPLPKKLSNWAISILCFLLPIFPTVLNEFMTGFKLVPQVINAFNTGANSGSLQIYDLLLKFWNFWTTVVNPWQYNTYLKDVYGVWGNIIQISSLIISVVLLVGGMALLNKKDISKKVFISFLITFIALPYLTKIYYRDDQIGLVFWGSAFSLIGSFPIIFLWQASVIDLIWNTGKIGKFVTALILVCFAIVNIFTEHNHIWEKKGDPRFNYGDKLKIVEAIKQDLGDRKYSFNFLDEAIDGGKEFLYLLDYTKTDRPVNFKGKPYVGSSLIEYKLLEGEPEVEYTVATRPNWSRFGTDSQMVAQSGDLVLYKNH